MFLFSKVYDIAMYTNDFHFLYEPNECRTLKDVVKFMGSTLLLVIMTISPRKIVYYSSTDPDEKSKYGFFKRLHEKLLRPSDLILRVPLVCSNDSTLLKSLKNGTFKGDKDIRLDYITVDDFRDYFTRSVNKCGVVDYDGDRYNDSIARIEELFESTK